MEHHNWNLNMEMDCTDEDFFNKCHADTDDEEFIRTILQQPPLQAFSSETESVQNNSVVVSAPIGVVSSPEVTSQTGPKKPRAYILSFDSSTMVPATPEPCSNCYDRLFVSEGTATPCSSKSSSPLPSVRAPESPKAEPGTRPIKGTKRARSSSQVIDHIMAERRRRQELTERFIALSATIPGLNKSDKASVLRAAIDYVKQLQDRVQELEKQDNKSGVESVIFIEKPHLSCGNEDTTTSNETSFYNCSILPEMEARVLGNEVLIEIHCEKQNGVELKILDHLESLHLNVTGSSVLPFGNSTLCITIIAQMGDGYEMIVDDLVKNLRQMLSKVDVYSKSDPY
ncbi:hypothetical protein RJT34_16927 [Clitoria ternatea]|uniref:BHLH domain-containing protein n=1 Tax=Clitoria ternatea TaxID=43366 RepID=A0AAN9J984_CLITE